MFEFINLPTATLNILMKKTTFCLVSVKEKTGKIFQHMNIQILHIQWTSILIKKLFI